MTKLELRKKIIRQRSLLTKDEVLSASLKITDYLLHLDCMKTCNSMFAYMSIKNEVDTMALISYYTKIGIPVYLPKIQGAVMNFVEMTSMTDFLEGVFHIPEPQSNKEAIPGPNDVMLVPGVAFSPSCNRIGYGGGYYDKYLAKHNDCMTIALAYDFQIVEDIIPEPFDIAPDMIVTPTTCYQQQYKSTRL